MPECPFEKDPRLRPVYDEEDWDAEAKRATASLLFANGRHVKERDVQEWSPSVGAVRRTYCYGKFPFWKGAFFTFDMWRRDRSSKCRRKALGFIPEDFESSAYKVKVERELYLLARRVAFMGLIPVMEARHRRVARDLG